MEWNIICRRDLPWAEVAAIEAELWLNAQRRPETFHLFAFEPRATFTAGISSAATDLLWNEKQLKDENVAVEKVPRGGKWTYHGPGQIVLFPIVNLKALGIASKGNRQFVDTLRNSLRTWLVNLNMPAVNGDSPYGIYVHNKKIASFGLSFQKGVSRHGAAIYYSPQQHYLDGIHPCGQSAPEYTSISEWGPNVSFQEALEQAIFAIKTSFQEWTA